MPRVLSVGRLDINTEGLLLLTNDGGLSRVLELPSTGWLRRYRVRAHGKVTQVQLDALKDGIAVEGVFYGSIEATLEREQGANVWISIGLREGKNREVKNILGALGLTVGRLIRVSFGPFQLGDLEEGAVREIRGRILRDQLGEKLVEESGADFDAPVLNEFSNTVVQGRTRREMEQQQEPEGEYRRQPREREWISSQPERRKREEKKKTRLNHVAVATATSGWLQVHAHRATKPPRRKQLVLRAVARVQAAPTVICSPVHAVSPTAISVATKVVMTVLVVPKVVLINRVPVQKAATIAVQGLVRLVRKVTFNPAHVVQLMAISVARRS